MKHKMVLIAGMLASCAPIYGSGRVDTPRMQGRVWALQRLQGERVAVRPENAATLRLNPDRTVSGTVACNDTSSAQLQWRGMPGDKRGSFDMLGRGPGITTTVLCGDRKAVAIGNRFWSLIETARAWSVDRGDLVIEFADGSEAHLIPLGR